MFIAITILVAVIGLIVGSFLNVVILRLHAGKQFAAGRSVCDHCGRQLTWWENIPLLSWLVLGGRCRTCKEPIDPQHPLVEALTATLFLAAYLVTLPNTLTQWLVLVLWLYVLASLVVLAVYDLRWYLLPDRVLLPMIAPAAAILLIEALSTHSATVAYKPLLAALLVGGAFYMLAAVSKGRWMGGGDIKLVFVIGLLLGLQETAAAMMIAFCSAALVGIGLILLHRKSRRDSMPFGPFLIGGTIIAFLWGPQLIGWYLNVSGFNLL